MVAGFYTIDDFLQSDNQVRATITFDPGHEVYKGHFPEQAVVPGVLQIQLIRELTEKALGQKLMLGKMDFAKFLHLILPNKNASLYVVIDLNQTTEGLNVSATIRDENLTYTKIKGSFSVG